MAPTKGGRSNREEMRESPRLDSIKGPLPAGDVVVTVPGGPRGEKEEGGLYKMEKRKSGFFQNGCLQAVMLVVLVVLSVSQVLLWVQVTYGGACQHNNQIQPPPPSSYRPSYSPSQSLNQDSNKDKLIADHADGVVDRARREVDNPPPVYITVDQYTEERAALQTQMAEMIKHPSTRLALDGYINIHEIDTQNSFHWKAVTAQSLFSVNESGQELQVATSGVHHISLTVMFSGRTTINSQVSSCSIKVASKSSDPYRHTTLLFVSRTQNQRGLRIGSFYPIDTVHSSGNFLLRRGDVIYVRPGTWSLGCQIHTEVFKTHLDAMLISKTGD